MAKIQLSRLIDFYTAVLKAAGFSRERARVLAEVQCRIHGFGVTTHGLRPLNHIIKDFSAGARIKDLPVLQRQNTAVEVYDCSGCVSVESIRFGISRGCELAERNGIGWVSLKNTGWIGALGFHLAEAARQGKIAMGWVNSSEFHGVAPFGGRDGRLSTNPMGYSFPGKEDPVVVDFSTSAVSNGKAHSLLSQGIKAPEEIFIDAGGNLSDDPAVLTSGGVMMSAGGPNFGYKGTALSLLIEALTAASGAIPVNKEKRGGHNAHLLVLPPQSGDAFQGAIAELLDWITSSRPTGEGEGPRIPGMRGWAALREAEKSGVEINAKLSEAVENLSETYGIASPF